jgi:hypothetical protein
MYSPAAWPPQAHHTTPVKATPIEIQMADSTPASLLVITCAVLCTSSRSATSSTVTPARKATQTHGLT